MKAISFYYMDEEQQWLGSPQDYPDYWEEADSFDSLQSSLSCLHFDLTVMNALKGRKAA